MLSTFCERLPLLSESNRKMFHFETIEVKEGGDKMITKLAVALEFCNFCADDLR